MIITPEIERLETTEWKEPQSQDNASHDAACLRRMLRVHPELDYADGLLGVARQVAVSVCIDHGDDFVSACDVCDSIVKAQALLSKINVK